VALEAHPDSVYNVDLITKEFFPLYPEKDLNRFKWIGSEWMYYMYQNKLNAEIYDNHPSGLGNPLRLKVKGVIPWSICTKFKGIDEKFMQFYTSLTIQLDNHLENLKKFIEKQEGSFWTTEDENINNLLFCKPKFINIQK
jgi:hypothetical protein